MAQPKISIGCVANLFSRMMLFEKSGDIEQGHSHVHAHLTLLTKGSLKVIINDVETIFVAPCQIYIEKEIEHTLIALEDNTLAFCIHALRDGIGVGDILDPESIPNGYSGLSLSLPTTTKPTEKPKVKPNSLPRHYFK